MSIPQSFIHPLCRAGAIAAAAAALVSAPASASAGPVAAGPNGSGHFAWQPSGSNLIHERTLGGDGTLGPAQPISWAFRYGFNASIGVDGSGAALIAWTSVDSTVHAAYVRRRAADGSLGPAQRLSPAGVSVTALRLAVEPDGDAIAVWRRTLSGRSVVQGRRRAAGGALGPIQTLSYLGGDSAGADVAVTPGGAATVAWIRDTPGGEFVQTRTVAPDGSLSDYQRVSPQGGGDAGNVSVTVSDAGRAMFSWVRETEAGNALEARARAATGTLGAVQTIAPPEAFHGSPVTAGNAAGRVAYTWVGRSDDGLGSGVWGRVRQTDGSLGPVFEVDLGEGSQPDVALDPEGHVSFAWREAGATYAVQARRRTFAGSMGAIRTLSAEGTNATGPRVAVDAGGKATVVWFEANADHWEARTVTPAGAVSPVHTLESEG